MKAVGRLTGIEGQLGLTGNWMGGVPAEVPWLLFQLESVGALPLVGGRPLSPWVGVRCRRGWAFVVAVPFLYLSALARTPYSPNPPTLPTYLLSSIPIILPPHPPTPPHPKPPRPRAPMPRRSGSARLRTRR